MFLNGSTSSDFLSNIVSDKFAHINHSQQYSFSFFVVVTKSEIHFLVAIK